MPIGSDAWRADGIDLMSFAHWIELEGGREVINGRRQPTYNIPFRQGTPEVWDAPFHAKTITLNMAVGDTNSVGVVTPTEGRRAHLRENLDSLITIFSKRTGPIALARDVPNYPGAGFSTRTAEVTVATPAVFQGLERQLRRVALRLLMPWPFWVGGPISIPTMSPADFFVEGSEITFPKITFDESGRLELLGTPHSIEGEAGSVADVRNRHRTGVIHPATPEWFPLYPGQNFVDGPRVTIEYRPQWP